MLISRHKLKKERSSREKLYSWDNPRKTISPLPTIQGLLLSYSQQYWREPRELWKERWRKDTRNGAKPSRHQGRHSAEMIHEADQLLLSDSQTMYKSFMSNRMEQGTCLILLFIFEEVDIYKLFLFKEHWLLNLIFQQWLSNLIVEHCCFCYLRMSIH